MASEFIGYTILVTLKGPPPTQYVRGIVADVVGPKLVLKDGMDPGCFDAVVDRSQSLFYGMANASHFTMSTLLPLRTWKLKHSSSMLPQDWPIILLRPSNCMNLGCLSTRLQRHSSILPS